jgi:hypothetical protein
MTMSIDGTSSPARYDETPASAGDNGDRRAEQADGQRAGPDDRGRRPGETLTREEYADAMRADGPPIRQESPDASRSPRSGSDGRADTDGDGRNGNRGRTARYDGDRDDGDPARGPDADITSSGSERGSGETSTRDQYAREMHSRPPLEQDGAPDHENGAGYGRADAAQQADADGSDRQDGRFSVVYVDGREVLATHNPADGSWIEGMGEIPDAPPGDPYGTGRAGEVVTSPEEVKKSTYERLNSVLCERFDDITDEIDRDTETIQDLHSKDPPQRPAPTFAGTADRSPEISPFAADHGVDFGHGLEAALVMAVVGAKLVNRVYEKWQQRAKDRHHGSD